MTFKDPTRRPAESPPDDAASTQPPADILSQRASGILLHPTSLPGGHGIGDLGPEAYRFVDFLTASRQSIWQILPLNPPGGGDSPYAALSAFAGNPLLISLHELARDGLLRADDLSTDHFPVGAVDFVRAREFKQLSFRKAFDRFKSAASVDLRTRFEDFRAAHAKWLDDFALFMALRDAHHMVAWTDWEPELAARRHDAMVNARAALHEEIDFQCFLQFAFFSQWRQLRHYANARQVRIVGDLPIFVAHDAVDVWTDPQLFYLDNHARPMVVAGVPPDAFSETGQRWGNPLYRWDLIAADGYDWWIQRIQATMALVDAVRIDHFRGFQAYWEVPASNPTAEHGRWKLGPGKALFDSLERALGHLPIIVEDLGLITPEVVALREELGYPGMKVLQFAFGGDSTNPYLPHNYERHWVVYTATHDNDTTIGWFHSLQPSERAAVRRYVGTSGRHIAWDLIRLALSSVANTAVVPMQDVLELGSEGRMNYPGHPEGNWAWRCPPDYLKERIIQQLSELTNTYGRCEAR